MMDSLGGNTPSKKVFYLDYVGSISFHRIYVSSMSRWLIAWVKSTNKSLAEFSSVTLDEEEIIVKREEKNLIDFGNCTLPATDSSSHLATPLSSSVSSNDGSAASVGSFEDTAMRKIKFNQILEVILPCDYERYCLSLIVNQGNESSLSLHVFQHNDFTKVNEFGECLKNFLSWYQRNCSGMSSLSSKNVSREDLDSIRFEVMLLGKLQSNELPTQLNFIDEAVRKYHSLELQHAANKEEVKMVQTMANNLSELHVDDNPTNQSHPLTNLIDGSREGAEELLRMGQKDRRPSFDEMRKQRCNSIDISAAAAARRRNGRVRHCSEPSTAANMGFDKNKTRIFQIGKQSITLISPDQSARNVQIPFSIIARCSKGVKQNNHFGVFVNETSVRYGAHISSKQTDDQKFKCYLFKCSEDHVRDEIMQAIKQACSMCGDGPDPLKAYHVLCKHINVTSGGSTEINRIEKGTNLAAKCIAENFNEAEQKRVKLNIEEACNEHPPQTKFDRLVVKMEMIRQIYEDRQIEHDVKLKQSRDPQLQTAFSKRFTFFKSRAKKSLNSFETLWGKGLQKMHELQHEAENHIQSPVERFRFFDNARSAPNTPGIVQHAKPAAHSRTRHHSESPAPSSVDIQVIDSNTRGSQPDLSIPRSNTLGSPSQGIINVRRKLNMIEKSNEVASIESPDKKSSVNSSPILSASSTPRSKATPEKHPAEKTLTMRQKIFITVTTPRSQKDGHSNGHSSPIMSSSRPLPSPLKTPEQLRMAWRRAIQDQITLNKIEKLSKLRQDQFTDPLHDRLNYEDLEKCLPDMICVWEELLETDRREKYKMESTVLHSAVRQGVPSCSRGKIWTLLHEQWKLRHKGSQSLARVPLTSYHRLLKELTPHHHAILIDLGRTFPRHPYFNKQLSDGQLALFNVLKAYSLADQEVGYCQGLSFVAGVLLMHSSSASEAFAMLLHIMYRIGCRKLYLPDMAALSVAVYQLSRLLHDFHSDLFYHFEEHEVSLMLFVTPWFLTMFASILPLKFTARIFDLLFLEGLPALFKIALCLLIHHKAKLLEKQGFENIVAYLKGHLSAMNDHDAIQVLNEAFSLDIADNLLVYEAEYAVLEDEGVNSFKVQNGSATEELDLKYSRLLQAHQTVTKYNLELVEQLEAARTQIVSLQQGLNEMAAIDEKRTLQIEKLRQQNEILKKSRGKQ